MTSARVLEVFKQVRPDADDFVGRTDLVTSETINSLDIMNAVAALEEEFGVEFEPDDVVAENFESLEAIELLVAKYVKG